MSVKMKAKEFTEDDEKASLGLVNGGHTILKCSNCDRGLVDIFHTQPKAIDPVTKKVFEWKMHALCCFCGDHSNTVLVKGKFHIGGYGKIKDDDESQDIPETFPDGFEEVKVNDEKIMVIKTVKA